MSASLTPGPEPAVATGRFPGAVIGRLGQIVLGYIAASVAAVAAFLIFGEIIIGPGMGGPSPASDLVFFAIATGFGGVICMAAAAPVAVPAIIVAERRRLRNPVIHAIVGGGDGLAIAVTLVILERLNGGTYPVTAHFIESGMYIALGVIGGLVYWAVAGRHAGQVHAAPRRSQGGA